jgi:hypothetical protein
VGIVGHIEANPPALFRVSDPCPLVYSCPQLAEADMPALSNTATEASPVSRDVYNFEPKQNYGSGSTEKAVTTLNNSAFLGQKLGVVTDYPVNNMSRKTVVSIIGIVAIR